MTMEKSVQITLIIAVAVVALGVLYYIAIAPEQTINANGVSNLEIEPDLVGVYFNVQTKGDTATIAKDENAEISDDLITALVKLRFERKEIVTQNYNVYPEYVYSSGSRVQNGFQATHSIKLEMDADDADDIGKVIDAGIDAGALVSYINFELSVEKQNQAKAEALKSATEDARVKAEAIAAGLGKKLGSVVSVNGQDFNYYPWQAYGEVASAGAVDAAEKAVTSIQPGDQDVRASVNVVYRIR